MLNVTSIKAPRPAVDWFSTAEGVERASADATLPADKVSLSPEARSQLTRAAAGGRVTEASGAANPELGQRGEAQAGGGAKGPSGEGAEQAGGAVAGGSGELTPEQRQQVTELQQRDSHVRAHEAAHQAAGGDLTGAATFSYQTGPDGRSYAVGGEVPIQSRSGRTPDETIAIARRVRAAALAPSDPSAADLAAASAASQVELRAMQQKRQLGPQGPAGVERAQRAGPPRAAAGAGASTAQAAPTGPPPSAGRAAQAAPISTPAVSLERLIVRAPEAEQFM